MSTAVRIRVDSPDRALNNSIKLVVESQGEPRKRYISVELSRKDLIDACQNSRAGYDIISAVGKITYIDGKLVPAS